MASEKLDMSLEDIIKMNRGKGGGRGNRGGGRGRPGRGSGGARFNRRDNDTGGRRNDIGVSGGGVQNRRDSRPSTYSKPKDLPDQWQHDMFDDRSSAPAYRRSFGGSTRASESRSAVLLISNLDFGVNDTDMKELFGEFGPLKKAAVHYDRSGRSLGNAEIEFENRLDAVKAMKQYNNVPLDGKPMKISMIGEEDDRRDEPMRGLAGRIGSRQSNDSRPRQNSDRSGFRGRRNDQGGFRGGRGRSGGGGGRGGGGRRENKEMPTKEDLDAELDAYNSKMEVV